MRPRLIKTPHKWTLDLHGRLVDDAIEDVEDALEDAVAAGVATLEVVHGASTTSRAWANRTIKNELYRCLDSGVWARYVAYDFRREGALLLALRR